MDQLVLANQPKRPASLRGWSGASPARRWGLGLPQVTVTESNAEMWPEVVLAELRHTCASLAIAAGANVLAVQCLLGHETASMTLNRYGHLFSDDLTNVARRWIRRLGRFRHELRYDRGTTAVRLHRCAGI